MTKKSHSICECWTGADSQGIPRGTGLTYSPSQGLLLPRSLCGLVRGRGAMEPLIPQHKDDWEWVSETDLVFIYSCGALMNIISLGSSKGFVLKESTTSSGSMEFNIYFLYPVLSDTLLLHCAVWSHESGTYSRTFNKMHILQPFQYLFVYEPLLHKYIKISFDGVSWNGSLGNTATARLRLSF